MTYCGLDGFVDNKTGNVVVAFAVLVIQNVVERFESSLRKLGLLKKIGICRSRGRGSVIHSNLRNVRVGILF